MLLPQETSSRGMEKSFTKKKNVPVSDKEVFKEITLDIRQGQRGKDSPESGSLYSDYESGQQYEDKVRPMELFMDAYSHI